MLQVIIVFVNYQVRHCCAEALCIAESVVHPRLPALGIHSLGETANVSNAFFDSSTFALATSAFESSVAVPSVSPANDAVSSFAPMQIALDNPELGKTYAVPTDRLPATWSAAPPFSVAVPPRVNAGTPQKSDRMSLSLPESSSPSAAAQTPGAPSSDIGLGAQTIPVVSPVVTKPTQLYVADSSKESSAKTTMSVDSSCQLKTEPTVRCDDPENTARKRKRASDVESDDDQIAVRHG